MASTHGISYDFPKWTVNLNAVRVHNEIYWNNQKPLGKPHLLHIVNCHKRHMSLNSSPTVPRIWTARKIPAFNDLSILHKIYLIRHNFHANPFNRFKPTYGKVHSVASDASSHSKLVWTKVVDFQSLPFMNQLCTVHTCMWIIISPPAALLELSKHQKTMPPFVRDLLGGTRPIGSRYTPHR